MTADALMSGFGPGEDLKRPRFSRPECRSPTVNPLDSGRFGVRCGFRSRKADMAAAGYELGGLDSDGTDESFDVWTVRKFPGNSLERNGE